MRYSFIFIIGIAFSCQRPEGHEPSDKSQLRVLSAYDSIDWYLPCPFDLETDPDRLQIPTQSSPRQLILTGEGPFPFVKEDMARVPISVHGRICPWKKVHRDIVFVIDVSGSMRDNDPKTSVGNKKTCERLKALDVLLSKLPAGITNFGVVTYNDRAVDITSNLYSTKEAIYNDLSGGTTGEAPVDIVCATQGGTNFGAGLNAAKRIFEQYGDPRATKEILFLSDGLPEDKDWPNIAKDLKENGISAGNTKITVSIASIFLGNSEPDPNPLKEMASQDLSVTPPRPIYAVAKDAGDLPAMLAAMLQNNKLQGSEVSYLGDRSSEPYSKVNVFDKLNAKNHFVTPPFEIVLERDQKTFNVELKYWDTMQNRSTQRGTIEFRRDID